MSTPELPMTGKLCKSRESETGFPCVHELEMGFPCMHGNRNTAFPCISLLPRTSRQGPLQIEIAIRQRSHVERPSKRGYFLRWRNFVIGLLDRGFDRTPELSGCLDHIKENSGIAGDAFVVYPFQLPPGASNVGGLGRRWSCHLCRRP